MEHQIVKYLDPNEQRVLQENIDLEEKITKLDNFLKTDFCKDLSFTDQLLLRAQLDSMQSYNTILRIRIQNILNTQKEVK